MVTATMWLAQVMPATSNILLSCSKRHQSAMTDARHQLKSSGKYVQRRPMTDGLSAVLQGNAVPGVHDPCQRPLPGRSPS